MLVSRPILSDHNETLKSNSFMQPVGFSHSLPMPGAPQHHSMAQSNNEEVGTYSAGNGCFLPRRIQSDFSGVNMYPGQSGSSLSSPDSFNYVPGSTASVPSMMMPQFGMETDQPCNYPCLGDGYDMKQGAGDMYSGGYGQPLPPNYPYGNTFFPQYPYDRYCGMDINDSVRRKNATRESTNTLKDWLQKHKKNPYPTKGEKIMLAIITKMTLTQVSTWFANARRRLKKENKMTWLPKNRSHDGNHTKKTDDDDDDTSRHSNDINGKTDGNLSEDSNDSEKAEVTSTNINDVTSTVSEDTTDILPDKKKIKVDSNYDITSSTSASTNHHAKKTLSWNKGGEVEKKQAFSQQSPKSDDNESSSQYEEVQSKLLASTTPKIEDNRFSYDYKCPPTWPMPSYQHFAANCIVSSSQTQVKSLPDEGYSSSSINTQQFDSKPFAAEQTFPANNLKEAITGSNLPSLRPLRMHKFPTFNNPQAIEGYRPLNRLDSMQNREDNFHCFQQDEMHHASSCISSHHACDVRKISSSMERSFLPSSAFSTSLDTNHVSRQHLCPLNSLNTLGYHSNSLIKTASTEFTNAPYHVPANHHGGSLC